MEFQEVVRKRKMVRSFQDRPLPKAVVDRIVANVQRAPSAVFSGVPDQARLRATFGVPDEYTAIGVVAIGYPKPTDRPSPSLGRGHRAVADVVRRGRWF